MPDGRGASVAPTGSDSGHLAGLSKLRGLLTAQFFGAFNDNAWRVMLTFLAVDRVMATGALGTDVEAAAQAQTTLATVALTLPLMLFSLPAGAIADRISKRTIILSMKALEVLLMAAGAFALYRQPLGGDLALIVLACMGAQSAMFSPAKYGILPELLPHTSLSAGNGRLEMFSTLAIIAGAGIAGPLLDLTGGRPWMAAAGLVALAVVGLVAARSIPEVPAARAGGGALNNLREAWVAIRTDRILWLAVLGSVFFWVVASVLFQVVIVYAKAVLGLTNLGASVALGQLMLGIAIGSVLAGRISGRKVEFGLIPLGALALGILTLVFGALMPGYWPTIALLILMGIAGGLLNVPINALKQWRSPDESTGAVLALSNIFIYGGMLAGSVGVGYLAAWGVSTQGIILTTALLVVVGTVWALYLMPAAFVRLVLVLITHTLYRVRIVGRQYLPAKGGALLVPNHASFIDAMLLLAANDRPIKFLAEATYYNHPLLHPFMKSLGVIPISSAGGPKLILRALREAGNAIESGELVCIFPEGQITRIGMLLPFQRGYERIVKGRDVPIVPIFLDRVWGSIFSRSEGRFFTKVPHKVPYPVTIAIGEQLPPGTPIHEVRRHVRELGSNAWDYRLDDARPLHHGFIRTSRRGFWKLAMADVTRPKVSRFKSLVGAVALARALRPHWKGQRNVGILLPPTVGGALVNIAAAMAGKTSVNLNFTSGKAAMSSAAKQAKLRTVVTNGVFLAKANVELPDGVEPIWIEEVGASIGAIGKSVAMLLALLAPRRALERACGAKEPVQPTDIATIIFSSGSTGEPKGVVLSHFNVDSNVRASVQVLPMWKGDGVLGILPFFHSFGYMATLWMPLTLGLPAVYHPSPLDTAAIGELVRRYRLTIMFATPTFLMLYVRRIAPAQFGSLRLVIAGAEKLQARVGAAFRDHFGLDPLEGYGVTETSPVLAVNVPDFRAPGLYQPGWRRGTVGQAVPGVALRIADPEDPDNTEPLGPGEEGMILAHGPNVMQGYLGREDLTDEAMRDGWYITGDIGKLDDDGFLTITDRYSRFSKIGGEMVPHGVVEEALHKAMGIDDEQVFAVTAISDPTKGERLAVLYTTDPEAIPDLLEKLAASGLPNLFMPRKDQFVEVDEIPVLGSGKTDLKNIKRIAAERLGVE